MPDNPKTTMVAEIEVLIKCADCGEVIEAIPMTEKMPQRKVICESLLCDVENTVPEMAMRLKNEPTGA